MSSSCRVPPSSGPRCRHRSSAAARSSRTSFAVPSLLRKPSRPHTGWPPIVGVRSGSVLSLSAGGCSPSPPGARGGAPEGRALRGRTRVLDGGARGRNPPRARSRGARGASPPRVSSRRHSSQSPTGRKPIRRYTPVEVGLARSANSTTRPRPSSRPATAAVSAAAYPCRRCSGGVHTGPIRVTPPTVGEWPTRQTGVSPSCQSHSRPWATTRRVASGSPSAWTPVSATKSTNQRSHRSTSAASATRAAPGGAGGGTRSGSS